MGDRVWRSVSFEFDDPEAMRLQQGAGNIEHPFFEEGLFNGGAEIRFISCKLDHRHERGRIIARFAYSLTGPAHQLKEDTTIENTTALLSCWASERGFPDLEISRAEMRSAYLGVGSEATVKDVTLEARAVVSGLRAFLASEADDFNAE